ncbi:MAG TPA: hypothetical protein VFA26_01700, partial [Gemmataceae bacterium]|nr:hypothetical protein [Gemmataceae bacterium]
AVGLCAAVGAAGAADKGGAPAGQSGGSWFGSWFGAGDKPAEKKPEPKARGEKLPKPPVKSMVDIAIAERERELQAYFRRQAVCLQLCQIALQTEDADLMRQAGELEQQAWAVYQERTAHLPVSAAKIETDEEILDRKLAPGQPAGQAALLPGSGPVREVTGQAAVEGKR